MVGLEEPLSLHVSPCSATAEVNMSAEVKMHLLFSFEIPQQSPLSSKDCTRLTVCVQEEDTKRW